MADDSTFRDLSDSIKATLYERLTNPFSQAFLLVVPVVYWKVTLAALFAEHRHEATLQAIEEAKIGCYEAGKLLVGISFVGLALPWLGVGMAWAQKKARAELRRITHDKLLNADESEKILKESATLRTQNRQLLSLLSEAESQGYQPRKEHTDSSESAVQPAEEDEMERYLRDDRLEAFHELRNGKMNAAFRYERLTKQLRDALLDVYKSDGTRGASHAGIEGDNMLNLADRTVTLVEGINDASVYTLRVLPPPADSAPDHTWHEWLSQMSAAEKACPGIVAALRSLRPGSE